MSLGLLDVKSTRVVYLNGDLSHTRLGLSDCHYALLASNICSIYHCGSIVHVFMPYTELRTANVCGTIEILKLACLANARVNYISTIAVEDANNHTGYAESKRVSEKLMEQARERGLKVTIFRPGKPYDGLCFICN